MKKNEIRELVENGVLQQKPVPELIKYELKNLVKIGFLQKLPNEFFAFNNNLTWEVIYDSLLFSERRHLHNLIANHIEQFNQNSLESVADLLLHHYNEANNWEKCVYFASIAGDRAASMYANEDAVNSYTRLLTALEKLSGKTNIDKCLTHEHIGDVYLTSGQDDNASKSFIQSLEIFRKNDIGKPKYVSWTYDKKIQESVLCRKIAMAHQGMAEYDNSLKWLDEAINNFPKHPGRVASQIYASKSGTFYRKGQLQEAVEWGRKALKIAKRLKSNEDIAYAYRILANSYKWEGKSHEAIKLLKNAIQFYEQLEDLVGLSTSNINLGVCYQLVSNLDLANTHYDSALNYCKRIHNESLAAIVHNNLGEVLMLRGLFNEAVPHFEATVKSYELGKSEKPLAGLALINICRCDRAKNKLSRAEEHLTRGRVLLKEVGSDALIVESDLDLAELYLDQEKYDQAIDLSNRNLEKLKMLDFAPLLVRGQRIMGNALAFKGDIDSAISQLIGSINLARKIKSEHEEAKSIISYTTLCFNHNVKCKSMNEKIKHAINILDSMGAELDLKQAQLLQSRLPE